MPELGLGTVQFGLNYGVSNDTGLMPQEECERVLHQARKSDITVIDTAAVYGRSEQVLGELLGDNEPWRVVTKLQPLDANKLGISGTCQRFEESLKLLRRPTVYGLMVHRCQDLLEARAEQLWEWMSNERDAGRAEKIGASVYHPRQADHLVERYDIDLIQLPLSVFDQRFEQSGCLTRLMEQGVEIHVRSVFLQGLLFIDPDELDPFFSPIRQRLETFRRFLHRLDMSPAEAALDYASTRPEVDVIVMGVNDAEQLRMNQKALDHAGSTLIDWSSFALDDEMWVVPSNWNLDDEKTKKSSNEEKVSREMVTHD